MITLFSTFPLNKTMDHSSKLLLSFVLVSSLSVLMCRELNPKPKPKPKPKPSPLLERLNLEGEGSTNCWDSLFELQSCTGEIVLFFLNGETFLGPSCCCAIRTIQFHCWPSMLGSVGINDEEGDILLGYCDASDDSGSTNTPPLPPSPPQAPNPITNTTSFLVINP